MSDSERKSIIDEKERKRLITEIGQIKDVLDSFKYGLNFEDFADELFKTIDRQTLAIKKLDEKMNTIIERMERLEAQLKEGIRVSVSGLGASAEGATESTVIIEEETEEAPLEDELAKMTREELEREASELDIKIAKYFEKENEYSEMVLNDPASAEEYEQKAEAARRMRLEAEARLREIKDQLE
ncbi:MAG: hypothetical protein K9W43_05895 [Candidatus Thorarchaeota archaeon]|nr:hypothetical protein [Candidatus Thorarchaeota archaeon]